MAASIFYKVIHSIFILLLFTIFPEFVKSMTIVSPSDGSSFTFGTPIPVNVINSPTDTATVYTASFVCAAGTYQVTGLALGTTYTLIPAALHGLANVIITAAGGTTAVTNIQISGPVPPTPGPTPIYTPTNCNPPFPPQNYPFPCNGEPECYKPCFSSSNNPFQKPKSRSSRYSDYCPRSESKHSDYARDNRQKPKNKHGQYSDYPPRNENIQYDFTHENRNNPINNPSRYSNYYSRNQEKSYEITQDSQNSARPHRHTRFSQFSAFEPNSPIPQEFYSPFERDDFF